MDIKSYSEVKDKFMQTMDGVCDEQVPLVLTREEKEPVVLMSLKEYDAMQETIYIMSSPRNHATLLKSIAEAERGEYEVHELIEKS